MPMKNTDLTATRFLMRLPANNGQVRELVIEGTGLTYAGSGALTGGMVTSIVLVTSDARSGDTVQTWTSDGVSVADLMRVMGNGFWNHVNTIGNTFPQLLVAYPVDSGGDTGGGDTGGGDTGGGGTGGGGTGGGDTGGGDTGGGDTGGDPTGRTIVGTPEKDRLRGTDFGEKIYGKESDDRIRGRGGDDTIMGGSGDDRIRGDKGNDILYGNSGDDRVRGDHGDDLIIDLQGDNRLRGGIGNDTLQSGMGRDVMIAGKGDDVVISGGGKDFVMGGTGADVFVFDGANAGTIDLKDFNALEDRLDVVGLDSAADEFRAFMAEARQVGDNVVWAHGATTVILYDTDRDDIGLGHFVDMSVVPETLL